MVFDTEPEPEPQLVKSLNRNRNKYLLLLRNTAVCSTNLFQATDDVLDLTIPEAPTRICVGGRIV